MTKPAARIVFWRRLGRAATGAVWSVPLRFVTIPTIAGAMVLTAGGALTVDNLLQPAVIFAGVFVSFCLRLLDNLALEFAVFPAILRILKGMK